MKNKRSNRIMVYFTVFLVVLVPTFLFVDVESILDDIGSVALKFHDNLGSYTYTNKYATANVFDAVTLYEESSDVQIHNTNVDTQTDLVKIPTPDEIAKLFSSYTDTNTKKQEEQKTNNSQNQVVESSNTETPAQITNTESAPFIQESIKEETTQKSPEQTYYESTLFDTSKSIRGGGGGGVAPAPVPVADTIAPDAPIVTTPSDFSSPFDTTTISFVGDAEADSILLMEYLVGTTTVSNTTTVDGGGNWNIDNISFDQGTTTINFYATDASLNRSPAATVSLGIDTSPSAPTITTPVNNQVFATTTISVIGTSTPSLIIHNSFNLSTTTADILGDWNTTLTSLGEGTTTLSFWTENTDSLLSANTTISVFVDTVAPTAPTLSINECSYSLSTTKCLTTGTTASLSWSTPSADISYFTIDKDGITIATTTSSSYSATITTGTSVFSIGAYDRAGNSATSTTVTIESISSPVVINEIAWNGTKSSTSDEWIELYNKSSETIDLTHVALYAEDLVPYITLSGTIAPGGYYLIERTDNLTTSVIERLATPFSGLLSGSGLNNSGEVLLLSQLFGGTSTSTMDQTPNLSDCGNTWCAGTSSTTPISMERVRPSVAGTTASNWASNNTYTVNGTDRDSNIINGTPGAQNSVNLKTVGYYCAPYTTSYIDGEYYTPTSGTCTYLSDEFSVSRYGAIYKGTVTNSTRIKRHSLGFMDSITYTTDTLPSPVQGDDYFTAVYNVNTQEILDAFEAYFQTGANPPPHLIYGILRWKYDGVAP